MGRDWQWGVIFDAGSSGTRAHIYKWTNESTVPHDHSTKDLASLPKLKLAKVEKTRPGISELADHPTDVGDYLQPLIDAAMAEIPAKKIPDTPIFVMATAGMRLVPEAPRAALLQQTCEYLRQNTRFHLPDCERHIRVIPGETEGLYGWLAANYLLGGFDQATDADDGARQDTYGFLDMGGASTQIVFAPNATEAAVHWDNLKLVRLRNVGGAASEYKVFSDSFLGFGANVARQRYVEALEDRYSTNGTDVLPDPCMPKGLRTTFTGDLVALDAIPPGEHTLVGTGDFEECLNQTYPLLRKDALCEDSPCLFNGQHAPAIDFDVTRFVGVSEYWHVTHGVFSSPGDKPYDLASYKENVDHFCGQDWAEIQRGILPRKKDSARKLQDAQDACFKASWMINVLYKGIGVPMTLSDTSRPDALNETAQDAQEGNLDAFMPINKIHGTEFSWTLGAMLLYVSGQILPTDASLPVGIGSNVAGIAADFERWGPSQWTTPVDGADTISEKAARAGPRLVVMALALEVWPHVASASTLEW
ncbi:related to apyrase (NDPase/NTPase) [Cephalotrichum gorgonifer]|uniref:Related to apyrase (NDPase/NTPase) n=1 Tax=Cephalotrichum gorgonifer TaxID=2041049 RepID=A0AAE8MZP5_9PEZI|nr:related to apyrase (NDPase/NTPase) [Cephalotrichum gorgonifer]